MSETPREHDAAGRPGDEVARQIRYPTNQVVAVLDTRQQVRAAAEELAGSGFPDSAINVITGATAANALDDSTGRTGLAGLAVRIAEKLGIEDSEMESKTQYENAMRDGKYVIAVAASGDERKERATQILRKHGAHTANYFSKFTIEGLVPPSGR